MTPPDARAEFAALVNRARLEQHLSIRTVARIAGVPPATAQGWLNGKHLPTPALRPQYLQLVERLGLTGSLPENLWEDAWATVEPALRHSGSPYLGLRPFAAADEAYYFGRTAETRRLAETIAALQSGPGHGTVFLVGPSGSGKSSLLAAGLLARECVDGVVAGPHA
ncbi:MAG: hypothetical protein VB036_11080, partial [Propionicimonas sp.]|nr:hypothetical protein [Propionicimonas sp.]